METVVGMKEKPSFLCYNLWMTSFFFWIHTWFFILLWNLLHCKTNSSFYVFTATIHVFSLIVWYDYHFNYYYFTVFCCCYYVVVYCTKFMRCVIVCMLCTLNKSMSNYIYFSTYICEFLFPVRDTCSDGKRQHLKWLQPFKYELYTAQLVMKLFACLTTYWCMAWLLFFSEFILDFHFTWNFP